LKIEDKINSEGDFISYAIYKLSGWFDLASSEENPKTGEKILIYEGDLGFDADNKIFGSPNWNMNLKSSYTSQQITLN
jgi:hypothetical protein